MQREFKLEVILSVLTGVSFVDNFNEVFDLAIYMFNDPYINDSGLKYMRNTMKEHLLNIHPELEKIGKIYIPESDMARNMWMKIQKDTFGEYLPVSKINQELDENKLVKSMK